MKTYNALLLAVMVAGAATIASEAHAQSNTERLVNINENTDSILGFVTGISDTLASIQESVDALAADLSGDLSTVTESSARVESAISGFGPTLNSIVSGVQLNAATLSDLSNIMAGMSTDITRIQASLVEGGDGGLAQSIDLLTSTVNRNEITTSDRLDAIEAAISRLEAKLDSPASVSPTGLSRDSVTYDVTTYTYKSQGTDVYELDLTFSCNGPVSIDQVSTDITASVTWIITNPLPRITTPENYLKVERQDLYNSRFETSPDRYQVYNRAVDFGLEQLSAGQTLDFESRQNDIGKDIRIHHHGGLSGRPLHDMLVWRYRQSRHRLAAKEQQVAGGAVSGRPVHDPNIQRRHHLRRRPGGDHWDIGAGGGWLVPQPVDLFGV
ncbi:MAG: hypothetical protein J4G04_04375 [Nitrosopumilaceae archaeon]|nr:hypothetical protein [Nitrosopumilaceae archaeon]